jgi:hypothetical protein
MNAPEAAVRFPVGGEVVAAGFAVVAVVTEEGATDDVVVDGSVDDVLDSASVAVVSTGAVDVEDSALFLSEDPEQAAAVTARRRKKTRRFTGAHHRAKP